MAFWQYALFEADYSPLEGLRALLLTSSAIIILNPTISLYGTSATYKYFQWIPESILGSVLLFVALNSIVAVVNRDLKYRQYTTFAMFVVWSFLFIMLFSANPNGMLIPWTGIFSVTAFINWSRVLHDYKRSKV